MILQFESSRLLNVKVELANESMPTNSHPKVKAEDKSSVGAGSKARTPQQQQKRPRVGGSSAKTAEVWRFFSQRPNGEQAATCSICTKTIKATNSR